VQLSLVNYGTLVAMHEFPRIFNRKDVVCLGFVYPIEYRGRVEDFPEPVGPVTSTIPFFNRQSDPGPAVVSVRQSWGMVLGIARITIAWLPRWTKTLTRKRAVPGRL